MKEDVCRDIYQHESDDRDANKNGNGDEGTGKDRLDSDLMETLGKKLYF